MPQLPPYDRNVRWTDYKIATPTFQLSPVEKPDMSPFLIHMTGKEEIYAILNGDNAPQDQPDNSGFLQSSVPDGNADYNAAVVCFTDAPTFAIDFFRYRRFPRWCQDQRFGIGFSKEIMVSQGVRPVLYLDFHLLQMVRNAQRSDVQDARKELGEALYPLIFPLGEDREEQGFIWEREWRHPNPEGLTFPLSAIKLICCPENEESGIREVLGENAQHVHFIRAWEEYNEVTSFLSEKESQWEDKFAPIPDIDNLSELVDLKRSHQRVIYSLEKHEQTIQGLQNKLTELAQEKGRLDNVVEQINGRIAEYTKCTDCNQDKLRSEMREFTSPDGQEKFFVCVQCYRNTAFPNESKTCFHCSNDFLVDEMRVWNDDSYPTISYICEECYEYITETLPNRDE